jgi:hypothetical protein
MKPAGEEKWDSLIKEHHYYGFERLSGKMLKYVAEMGEEWVALLGG